MLVLGVDTSTSAGSVALVGSEGLCCEWMLNSTRTHSERLLKAVDWALKEARSGINKIEGFAVAQGPGSFTGLRIGLATVKTLAGSLNKPVVGMPTLDIMAWNVQYYNYQICPLLDARKGEVYTAVYRFEASPPGDSTSGWPRLIKLTENLVIDPKKLISLIHTPTLFLGEGLSLYRNLLAKELGERAFFAPPVVWSPRASTVAFLGRERLLRGEADGVETLVPLYVRPSEAELKKK
jgi:tRNA threonylcarbamoyladenosine biosynthesis protein TsaB